MDNFDLMNFDEGGELPPSSSDEKKTIPFDDSDPAPAPSAGAVSRKPLNLGGGKPSAAPTTPPAAAPKVSKPVAKPAPRPAAKPAPARAEKPAVQANPVPVVAGERISRMKIFVIKLHHGSLEYLEEQIADWLKDNPDVVLSANAKDYVDIAEGRTNAMLAMATGKFKLKGNIGLAMKLEKVFKK